MSKKPPSELQMGKNFRILPYVSSLLFRYPGKHFIRVYRYAPFTLGYYHFLRKLHSLRRKRMQSSDDLFRLSSQDHEAFYRQIAREEQRGYFRYFSCLEPREIELFQEQVKEQLGFYPVPDFLAFLTLADGLDCESVTIYGSASEYCPTSGFIEENKRNQAFLQVGLVIHGRIKENILVWNRLKDKYQLLNMMDGRLIRKFSNFKRMIIFAICAAIYEKSKRLLEMEMSSMRSD